ncbi:hypothetical protein Tco_0507976 [Tanacetum coccineum]
MDTYSVQAPSRGVTDWYQEPSYWLFQLSRLSLDSSEDIVERDTFWTSDHVRDNPRETPIIAPYYSHRSPEQYTELPRLLTSSDSESDPFKDPSSDLIPPLLGISPFLSSDDDTTNSDTPDTPPSPTHSMPFTKITAST